MMFRHISGDGFMRGAAAACVCFMTAVGSVWAQQGDSVVVAVVHYRVGSSLLLYDYRDNARALDAIARVMTDSATVAEIERINITAGASPEGDRAANQRLAVDRALALKGYMMWKYPWIDRDKINTFSVGEDWDGLRTMVAADTSLPWRGDLLGVLDIADRNTRQARLRTVDGGRAYRSIAADILPRLRGATAVVVCFGKDDAPVKKDAAPTPVEEPEKISETPREPRPAIPTPEPSRRPLPAIKTNLLYDAATALNVEVEVPLGGRWSVAGEWVFPWWLLRKEQHAFQIGAGAVEGRCWLNGRTGRRTMTGWFAGLYAGGGYYDIEWGERGDQGEFFHAGASGGYAHTIGRGGKWRMEYALGLGVLRARYREYEPLKDAGGGWHLVLRHHGTYTWTGPTRAKVSLVRTIGGKGGAR